MIYFAHILYIFICFSCSLKKLITCEHVQSSMNHFHMRCECLQNINKNNFHFYQNKNQTKINLKYKLSSKETYMYMSTIQML